MDWTLIRADGTLEERSFIMRDGVPYISKHISKSEFDADDGSICAFGSLLDLFEHVRKTIDRPIRINSGFRTTAHQARLTRQGYNTATDSPHLRGAAIDCALPTGITAERLILFFRQSAHALKLPRPRFGWKSYGGSFLHVDLVFMLYEPFVKCPSILPNGVRIGGSNPHPINWAQNVTW